MSNWGLSYYLGGNNADAVWPESRPGPWHSLPGRWETGQAGRTWSYGAVDDSIIAWWWWCCWGFWNFSVCYCARNTTAAVVSQRHWRTFHGVDAQSTGGADPARLIQLKLSMLQGHPRGDPIVGIVESPRSFFLLLSLSRFRFLRCQLVRPYPAVLSVQNKRKMWKLGSSKWPNQSKTFIINESDERRLLTSILYRIASISTWSINLSGAMPNTNLHTHTQTRTRIAFLHPNTLNLSDSSLTRGFPLI